MVQSRSLSLSVGLGAPLPADQAASWASLSQSQSGGLVVRLFFLLKVLTFFLLVLGCCYLGSSWLASAWLASSTGLLLAALLAGLFVAGGLALLRLAGPPLPGPPPLPTGTGCIMAYAIPSTMHS